MATTSFQTPQKGSSPIGSLHCHVFAGSKGGTGKTTVLFHAAAQYAKDNPDVNVLVVDCSFAGDISERLLGGAAETNGRTIGEATFEKLDKEGKSARSLFRYLYSNMSAENSTPGASQSSAFTSMWRRLTIDGQNAVPPPTPPQSQLVNVAEKFGVRVSDHNPRFCVQNLFLIPGGATARQPCAGFDDLQGNDANIRRLANALREHLNVLPGVYKVYFDTDGELDMSSSMQVVVRCCDSVALFTETDPSDFRRVRVFLEDLLEIRRVQMVDENSCAGIAAVVFNKVEPDPRSKPFVDLGCSITPHMIAARSLILSFAQKASNVVLNPETQFIRLRMFTNIPQLAPGTSHEDQVAAFKKSSFMVMQSFKKLGFLGSDLGIPFCCVENGKKYKGEHGEYTADNEKLLASLIENIRELNERL